MIAGRVLRRTGFAAGLPVFDVGPILKRSLFDAVESVVMTSATLTTAGEDPFAYMRSRLGLQGVHTLKLGSPFNYREQVTAYVEADMPDPGNEMAFALIEPSALDLDLRFPVLVEADENDKGTGGMLGFEVTHTSRRPLYLRLDRSYATFVQR